MPSPFPGMDPYLETPSLWPDVHHGLLSEIQAVLNRALRPRFSARVEMRVYVADEADNRRGFVPDVRLESTGYRTATMTAPKAAQPVDSGLVIPTPADEETEEATLHLVETATRNLVTVIEVLSPANKVRSSPGRASFLAKRRQILATDVHWVEIDLLRRGTPSVATPPLPASDYRVLVCRGDDRPQTRVLPFGVRDVLPVVGVPLTEGAECPLDLGAVFREAYDRGGYDLAVDYALPPDPPLGEPDAAWAEALAREYLAARA